MTAEPTDAELAARYRSRIETELAELDAASEATSGDRAPVTLDQQSVGRLSRMDALQGQAMAAALEARRGQRRLALEAALRRIGAGEFGWCARCGDFIGAGRLDIDPAAMTCVVCAGEARQ
ncbi:TraR/DksA C4-type zinc finger protein [Defluviimonas sp. WL0024]|uniref:TraR/DksA C4-type zinc finger protein n=2 Tax=Albidovulum TaxID=205889 RepID=A0ABT3J3M6_9RHOB|nr:TraR/DksA C4-type zinc finger protein [Defluviimonas sp. WL0024]MCU9848673.1 TraR/DksA C4-type zinc finger protein [Defluviimonas sp. WL0024]MCW3782261.1 TraR/DksA C4-type zinc finger protein [Defluviimonas salinarum]